MAREVNSREWVWTGSLWVPRKATDDGEAKAALMGYDGSDWQDLQVESATYKNLKVVLYQSGKRVQVAAPNNDGVSAGDYALYANAFPLGFNGSTWDRWRNNQEITLLASGTRSASTTSPIITLYNASALLLYMYISAATLGASPEVRLIIWVYTGSDISEYYCEASWTPAAGQRNWFALGPGVGDIVTGTKYGSWRIIFPAPVPRRFKVRVEHVADITDLSYSITGFTQP